ncbi:MAG TPA: amino acid permease, partial [Spirochaetia bacterium]|nr:amino acid permease [Spirochaetia bacterium]
RHIFFVPILAIAGAKDAALWFASSPSAWFLVTVFMLIYVAIVIASGMKAYAKVQKFCFWTGNLGLLFVFAFLLLGTHDAFKAGLEANAAKLFGCQPGVYEATIAMGQSAGAITPLRGGSLGAIFLAMPYIVFFNLWPNWGATLYGEVKGSTDFKKNFWGMAAALIATTVLAVILYLLIAKTMSWEFYNNANAAYWSYRWDTTGKVAAPPLPVWPYPALLALFLTTNPVIQIIVLAAMSLWFFGWAGTIFLSSTRVIFSAAFDRMLPEAAARLEPKTRAPINAMLLMVIPGLIVSVLYIWNIGGFASMTLASTLVIAVTFLGTTISAIILPFKKRDLYESSPIANFKIGKLPLISVFGVIFAAFLIFLLYEWIIDPNGLYGISYRNTTSMIYMIVMYALALGIYLTSRWYRKKKGIAVDKIYKEIPLE